MPECYADLAREYDRQSRHDDAIASLERAIELGWGGKPHPRSDIAEFHLRAGRHEDAAAIWSELKGTDPDDVWLYNAAGLSYSEIGQHELAIAWLGEGIELAMRTEDPEGIINQLSDVRRRSLSALGRELDELEGTSGSVHGGVELGRAFTRAPAARLYEAGNFSLPTRPRDRENEEVDVSIAWFPADEYEMAIERWPSLAEDWAGRAPQRLLRANGRQHQMDA